MQMTLIFRALVLYFFAITTIVHAAHDTNIIAEITGRFHPTKPTVVMNYDVTYVLLHFRLKRVASASLKVTEGVWHSHLSNEPIPACIIDFQVASPQTQDDQNNEFVSLFKRTISVLTMPDLQIITYAKQNDEFIRPLFRKGRRMNYIEIYNFESGTPTYRHHDRLSGTVETNLPGMADLAKQSTEVAVVLKTLYAAYQGKPIRSISNNIHFNVDGAVRSFDLKMKKGQVAALSFPQKLSALHADICPAQDNDSCNESFSMWCIPFREFSLKTADPELKELAKTSLEWSMLPIRGEYCLFLGAIECTLIQIGVLPQENILP